MERNVTVTFKTLLLQSFYFFCIISTFTFFSQFFLLSTGVDKELNDFCVFVLSFSLVFLFKVNVGLLEKEMDDLHMSV